MISPNRLRSAWSSSRLEFFQLPLAQLPCDLAGSEARGERTCHPDQHSCVLEVGFQGLCDTRVLDLHRYLPAIDQAAAVHLADRSGGESLAFDRV